MVGYVAIAALWMALIAFGLGWALMIEGDRAHVHAGAREQLQECSVRGRDRTRVARSRVQGHEVEQAMAQASTHVGTSDLPLEEWIRIGLRDGPKPGRQWP